MAPTAAAAVSHSAADPSGLHPLSAQLVPDLKSTNISPPGEYGGIGGVGGCTGGGDGGWTTFSITQ